MCDDENESRKLVNENSNYSSIPDADREFATSAFQEFKDGKYEQCLNILQNLYFKRPQDIKVLHNSFVTEYYLSRCTETEEFQSKLLDLCKTAHIKLDDMDSFEDVDNIILVYNHALVLFHLHQYFAAVKILDKIFSFLEPLEDSLSRNILFLLIDCYLNIHQPKKASIYMIFAENLHFNNIKTKQNKDRDNDKENGEHYINDQVKRRFQFYKARLYVSLKTSKACKREIKNLMSSGSGVQNIPALYIKSQLEYQRGNYRKSLKLLGTVNNPDDFLKYFKEIGDLIPVMYYNNYACNHFYMGKPHLGKIYIKQALENFHSYLKQVTDSGASFLNSRPLHLMSTSTNHLLIYNLGMMAHHCKHFRDAFECYKEVLRSYPQNPRLWLRIAECCIQLNKPDNMEHYNEIKVPPFAKAIVGSGKHRKLILNSTGFEKFTTNSDLSSPTLEFALLSLENAYALLPDFRLYSPSGVPVLEQSGFTEDMEGSSEDAYLMFTLPSGYLQGSDIVSLKHSIIVTTSYVALCLGEVNIAHKFAKLLLSEPRISMAHKFLANQYAGEALLHMDRITEAVEHLSVQYEEPVELAYSSGIPDSLKHQVRFDSKQNDKTDDGSKPVGNIPNWFPNNISSARFVSFYNLAVAYAVREEWNKSLESLLQINPGGEIPSQASSLLMYVKAHQGTADYMSTYTRNH